MKTACVVTGRVTADGTLELDERPPLPPGPVRVSVETVGPLTPAKATGTGEPSETEIRQRKARMESAIGCLSDVEAETMLRVIEGENRTEAPTSTV